MRMLFFLMLIVMIPVGVFFYFYYRRTLLFWSRREENRGIRIVSILLAVCTVAASANMFYTPALVFLHVGAVQLVWQLLYLLIRKIKADWVKDKSVLDRVYRCGLVPWLVMAVILSYGYFHMKDVNKKEYSIATEKEVAGGYKIAMLSDLHFGTTMNVSKLKEYCAQISAEKPDFIALCGDIVDERTTKEEMAEAMKILGSMTSTYGTYYVFGNHDSAQYASNPPFTTEDLKQQLTANGIRILSDEVININENLVLAGRLDRGFAGKGNRKTAEEILNGIDKNKYIVLLDHQPVEFSENAKSGVDLQLSGHTHGGQIWPVGLISDLLGFGELNYGEKAIDKFHVIVSSGIAGWGYPIRTGSDSEYLVIHIGKAG